MKTLVLATLVALSALVVPALANETVPAGAGITITNAWLRATPNGAKVAGGYVTIKNDGATPDTLFAASIPAASNGEVHEMSMANGVMHMGRLDKGLIIPPGASVTLAPGGNHLMFLNLTAPIKEGTAVAGTLTFAKAGIVPVAFAVGGMGAKTPPASMNGMGAMSH